MKKQTYPILYSFRRCPYAMRARIALQYANIRYELREIVLRNKPQAMLNASPKGTVPVLVLHDHNVIDESLDVMLWALAQMQKTSVETPNWVKINKAAYGQMIELISQNDTIFKPLLDRYKYPNRFLDHPQGIEARTQAEKVWLIKLEERLGKNPYLMGNHPTLADVALFPFLRQFANTDREWFDNTPYPYLKRWFEVIIESPLFQNIMQKYSPWIPGQPPVLIN